MLSSDIPQFNCFRYTFKYRIHMKVEIFMININIKRRIIMVLASLYFLFFMIDEINDEWTILIEKKAIIINYINNYCTHIFVNSPWWAIFWVFLIYKYIHWYVYIFIYKSIKMNETYLFSDVSLNRYKNIKKHINIFNCT